MEIYQGKKPLNFDAKALAKIASQYDSVLFDIGTGDGRFVLNEASRSPQVLAIGVDACRENLPKFAQKVPTNALFVIANALDLPGDLFIEGELREKTRITINFPWGSLLDGLLACDSQLMGGLRQVGAPDSAKLEVRLNASALAQAGWELNPGGAHICESLWSAGYNVREPRLLNAADLRDFPTTWAKRMAFSRRPEAVLIRTR